MRQLVTKAIILGRTDYGEADRILILLTPDQGKLVLLAKGVRRVKSKLAGGIELFSVSEITYIKGRGEVGTLVSTRLLRHYEKIVTDLSRTMLGYELLKTLHKATEDTLEPAYFEALEQTFEGLQDMTIPVEVIQLWFSSQLIRLNGHTPNLQTDNQQEPLSSEQMYQFDYEHMAFMPAPGKGRFQAPHIKLLRLLFAGYPPKVLSQVRGGNELLSVIGPLIQTLRDTQH